MKFILLLLLFLNMLVYFWASMLRTSDVKNHIEPPLYNQSALEILHVVSEKALSSTSPGEDKIQKVVEQESMFCLSIGDYEKDKAVIISNTLVGLSEYLFIIPNDTLIKERYWLFSPAGKRWENSVKNASNIRSKGINDIWLVPKGKDKGKVSLGLYSTLSKAEKKLQALMGMQINVELSNVSEKRYSIRLENIYVPEDIFKQLDKRFEEGLPNIQEINC